ncbi:MAG: LLM class flavin-dependent oxidoreductase [Acidimicrobiales bacterium]|nr:LLM class flavin-dependent oxidoreductase [Acidimicrobiales bacterium]
MRIAIGIGGAASGRRNDFQEQVDFVREAERLGVDVVWSAEAWGQDAVVPLAYLAARTERVLLGSGIMQISARVPSMTAMTALTMATVSDDRFILGLGASGPQVVEGLNGQPFARPLERLREHVDIVRLAFAGEKLVYDGHQYVLPRPGGEGKALRLAQPGNPNIPIYLATLGPAALRYTGASADGWVGTSFVPEAADVLLGPIAEGAAAAGRDLTALDLQAGGSVAFGDRGELLDRFRPGVAFPIGAMGSKQHNFYREAFIRAGYAEDCAEVARLWLDGKRDEAIARVPDELVVQTTLIGTDAEVAERIAAYRRSGITTLRVQPEGADQTARLDTLARVIDLIRADEQAAAADRR